MDFHRPKRGMMSVVCLCSAVYGDSGFKSWLARHKHIVHMHSDCVMEQYHVCGDNVKETLHSKGFVDRIGSLDVLFKAR